MIQYILIGAIIFLSAFVQGTAGFGFGMVAMGLLPLVLDVKFSIPFVAVYALIVCFILMLQLRKHLDKKKILPLLVGALLGTPVGVLFLKSVDASIVKLCLGIVLVFYSLYSLINKKVTDRKIKDTWGYIAGFLGGILGGAFNTSGPPVIIYTTLKNWDKDGVKSTLQVFFSASVLFQVILYIIAGIITKETLIYNLYFLPCLVVGVLTGSFLYNRIDHQTFKKIVFVLLLILGFVFIFKR